VYVLRFQDQANRLPHQQQSERYHDQLTDELTAGAARDEQEPDRSYDHQRTIE